MPTTLKLIFTWGLIAIGTCIVGLSTVQHQSFNDALKMFILGWIAIGVIGAMFYIWKP